MMRNIHLGMTLDFSTPEIQWSSEQFLLAILAHNAVVNHRYLRDHPETPSLYTSGVVYSPPDQSSAANRLSAAGMNKVRKLLASEGVEPYRIDTILRLLDGVEEFLDIPALYARGHGDCNELVPVRLAELWRAGVQARGKLIKHEMPTSLVYHAIVEWPDGSREDPSLILGMGGPARASERAEEIRANRERWENHMATGMQLVAQGADPFVIGRQIDMMGLVPRRPVPPPMRGRRAA